MKNRESDERERLSFTEITTYTELKRNLHSKANSLQHTLHNNNRYLCHYTNIEAAVKIIQDKMWYIGSPINMNDGLELSHADRSIWGKIFFASFMLEPNESIAMWSMYAQPWSNGVMIRIPVEKFKKLVKSNPIVHPADATTKNANTSKIISAANSSFHAVAYSNAESRYNGENEKLQCGGEVNDRLTGVLDSEELTGYIKDIAWSYENEYRLRVDINDNTEYEALSINLSEDFVESIEIVAGPRFEGELLSVIQRRISKTFNPERLGTSLFAQKLNWVYCDSCRITT